MNCELLKGTLSQLKGDITVVGIFKGEETAKALKALDTKLENSFLNGVNDHLTAEGFKAKLGDTVSLPTFGRIAASRLFVVGLGSREDYSAETTRKLCANLARRIKPNGANVKVALYIRKPEKVAAKSAGKTAGGAKASHAKAAAKAKKSEAAFSEVDHVKAAIEGWILGRFDFDKYKSSKDNGAKSKTPSKGHVTLAIGGVSLETKVLSRANLEATSVAEATNFARGLIAEPPSYMTPTRLSIEAKNIAAKGDLTCTIYNTAQMEKMGMGCFLGVARGADEPPKFIVLKYTAPGKNKKTVAIIGKGITFDSGGLSLKPAQSMERMKYDMSGAAAILATMRVVAALKPNVSVLGVVAATENMPSGKALHPGDVLKSMNGKTVEVNNTDAEGRLVLADALTYALQQKVDELIDVATLTGAVVQALGRVAAGIMGTNQELIDNIMKSGEKVGERFWQLPLYDDYKPALSSDVADLMNAGSRGEAGSSCAGMFLKEFVDGKPWAHLDIAGVAWSEKNKDEINKGGTGFAVRTLSAYLMSQ